MAIEQQIVGVNCDASGCPRLDSRELLEISREAGCRDSYWFYENSFSERRTTTADKFELQNLGGGGRVAPTLFTLPCKKGEPLDVTRASKSATVDFLEYAPWVHVDPCEVDGKAIQFPDDCDPYDRLPYQEKYRRHVADKTALLRRSVLLRYEIMSTMMKLHGYYIGEGPKMNRCVFDFQRNPCLTVAMKQTWCRTDAFPIEDLEYLIHLSHMITGVMPARLHFGVDAWSAFYGHHSVRKRILSACECQEPGHNIINAQEVDCEVEFLGQFGNIPIYVDSRVFPDEDGNECFMVPTDGLLIESPGMEGISGHGKIHNAAANFEPGDLFMNQTFDGDEECWKLTAYGSIVIMPRNVNRNMLVRNLSKVMTYPGQKCSDILVSDTGEIFVPPMHGSEDESQLEVIAQQVADNDWFEVCSMIVGRTPPTTPCTDKEHCVPGEACRITPSTNPCPGSTQRVISKANLIAQGIDLNSMCDLVRHHALKPITMPSQEQQLAPFLIETPASLVKQ